MKRTVWGLAALALLGLGARATAGYIATDLGSLGGSYTYAQGINDAGQVAGGGGTANNSAEHAFLYANGQIKDLGTLGGTYSYAYGINDAG